jgi:hypothetical protein
LKGGCKSHRLRNLQLNTLKIESGPSPFQRSVKI